MVALKAARAFTGRPKVAKVEGAYHGGYDYAEVSQAPKPRHLGRRGPSPRACRSATARRRSALDDVVIIPFNDPDRAIAILDEHADDLACVLLDLMPHRVGLNPAARVRRRDARLDDRERRAARARRGHHLPHRVRRAAEALRPDPDLTAMGKMIGGGFPVGAVAGRARSWTS
jgi:glutamate-1-semialdehyde 2,1-aminomutase